MRFGESSVSSNIKYVCSLRYEEQGKQESTFTGTRAFRANSPTWAAEIVEALIAVTRRILPMRLLGLKTSLGHSLLKNSCEVYGTEPPECMAALRCRARYLSQLEPSAQRLRTR